MKRSLRLFAGIAVFSLLACKPARTDEQKIEATAKVLPWIVDLLEFCNAYKDARFDRDQLRISLGGRDLVKNAEAHDVRGVVERIIPGGTDHPDEFVLHVTVEEFARFTNQFGKRAIKKGSDTHKLVSELNETDCVVFTGANLVGVGPSETQKLCVPRFYADFLHIERCK